VIACGTYDPNATTELYQPDYDIYVNQIHPWMNRQCGTLDCHGQVGRPFRVYGARGLRLYDRQARLAPGGADTVPEEFRASYESLIGLEPEATRRVVAGDQEAQTLLIIRKPAGSAPGQTDSKAGERHKGGTVGTTEGGPLACLIAWLEIKKLGGFTGASDCQIALDLK
jgi:hypothetical protein